MCGADVGRGGQKGCKIDEERTVSVRKESESGERECECGGRERRDEK